MEVDEEDRPTEEHPVTITPVGDESATSGPADSDIATGKDEDCRSSASREHVSAASAAGMHSVAQSSHQSSTSPITTRDGEGLAAEVKSNNQLQYPPGDALRTLCETAAEDTSEACDLCGATVATKLRMAFHQRQEHPDLYKFLHPKSRGRIARRRRYDQLFISQIKLLHPLCTPPPGKSGDFYYDPIYFVPGVNAERSNLGEANTGISVLHLDRYLDNGNFACPTPGCGKQYKREYGLAYHAAKGVCEPADPDIIEPVMNQWAQADTANLGLLDPRADRTRTPLLRDAPFFTQYRWPQEDWGIWCIPLSQVETFTGMKGMHQQNSELDCRWATPNEKRFLHDNHITSDGDITADIIVLKAEEVLLLLEIIYPEWHEKLLHLRRMKKVRANADESAGNKNGIQDAKIFSFEDEEDFSIGSRTAAKEAAKAAASQASQFNASVTSERVLSRQWFYDHNTKTTHVQTARILYPQPRKRQSRYQVAMLARQPQPFKRFRTLEEAKEFLNPKQRNQGVSRMHSNPKHSDAQKERVKAKIRARHQGLPDQKAMRKASRHERCGLCGGTRARNKFLKEEDLVACATCPNVGHPSCLEIDADLTEMIRTYEWQCIECKICSVCRDPGDEDKMLFCDVCDRGYHTFCVGLKSPPSGRWICNLCGVCASCGATSPGDPPNAKWQHEYDTRGDEPRFLQTLCMECSAVFREGDFCASCLVVYKSDETDLPMVQCDKCDRWIHTECDDIDDDRYEDLSSEGSYYECLLCRGEQEERYDAFHRRNR